MTAQLTYADAQTMLSRLRLWAAQRRQLERIDKWCHGGIVSYRLPLGYRIACANGAYR